MTSMQNAFDLAYASPAAIGRTLAFLLIVCCLRASVLPQEASLEWQLRADFVAAMHDTEPRRFLDRLLVDRLEFRHLRNRFVLRVGRIARYVNMERSVARVADLDEESVMRAAVATAPTYITQRDNIMPLALAQQPILAGEKDGVIYLLDGLQRAHSAFQHNAATVRAIILPLHTAVLLGSDEPPDDNGRVHRLLEATRHNPVGAHGGSDETRAIVKVEAAVDLSRGRPPQTDLGAWLHDLLLFKTACAVSRELVLTEFWPGSARAVVDRRAYHGAEDQILDAWNRAYAIPPASRWKETADQAARVIRRFTQFDSLSDLKAALRADCVQDGEAVAAEARDTEVAERNILLKAYGQYKRTEKQDRRAIKHEETKEARGPNAIRAILTGLAGDNLSLDINEQIRLAKCFGINPTWLSREHLRIDPIFEAYVFAYFRKDNPDFLPPPFLVETFLQRLELAEARHDGHDRHVIKRMWDDVFEWYDNVGLQIAINEKVLADYDRAKIVDGPLPPHLVQVRGIVI